MPQDFEKLFTPYKLRTFEVRNRLVMPPMAIYIPGCGGYVQDRLVNYYEARARGGVGFVVVNATYVHPNGASHPNQTSIVDDRFVPGLARLAEVIHAHGAKASIQLYHSGRQRFALIAGGETLSPSGISDPVRKDPARAPTIEELHELAEDFGQAARRAKEAGFDAIELHCAHGYLLSGFLSPYQNRREDEYGGDVHGRTRFILEIMECCRRQVGDDFLIGARLNGHDYVNGGNDLEDARQIARILVDNGLDLIHVSAGMAPSAQYSFLPAGVPQGFNVYLAEGIGEAVDVPVIACGAIEDPVFAESVLQRGKVGLVAMGRPLFADPDLPNKAREGRLKEIRPCLRCSKGAAVWPEDMRCVVNPAVGKEAIFDEKIAPADKPRKVVVVGGGPGGLEAARLCALRGHRVVLMEKGNAIGGKIHLAKLPPGKSNQAKWVEYYENEMRRLGVEIRLGVEAAIEAVKKESPDHVIVATGGQPLRPASIKGVDLPGVITAEDVLKGEARPGRKVAVIGGSSMGVETAAFILAHGDHEIVVVEMLPRILSDISHDAELFLMDELADKNFRAVESTRVTAIEEKDGRLNLAARRYDLERELTGFDSVVLAVGVVPDDRLGKELAAAMDNVHLVGDCEGAGDYRKAVHDAAAVALSI